VPKQRQLFILQKYVAALIFARNDKQGSYTGFYKVLDNINPFYYEDFLAANALPGPNSTIHCVLQNQGPLGFTEQFKMRKNSTLSQIPGIQYGQGSVANLPRPREWHDSTIGDAVLRTIDIK